MFGAVMLSFWLLGGPALIELVAWRCKANTCVGRILGGASLVVAAAQRAAVRRIWAVQVSTMTVLPVLTLLEYGAGVDLGIDELIARDWPYRESAAHPNRMAPNAALS